eukprot:COSAG06_NODE_2497_length_6757_cov_80.480625_2_plen_125_part_00
MRSFLPRQARDKHRESTQSKETRVSALRWGYIASFFVNSIEVAQEAVGEVNNLLVRNAIFVPFIYKTIILPRQARDKHKKSSNKVRFSQVLIPWAILTFATDEQNIPLENVLSVIPGAKNDPPR